MAWMRALEGKTPRSMMRGRMMRREEYRGGPGPRCQSSRGGNIKEIIIKAAWDANFQNPMEFKCAVTLEK